MAKTRPNKSLKSVINIDENQPNNLPVSNGDLYGVFLDINEAFNINGLESLSEGRLNRDELMQLLDYINRLNAEVGLKNETYNEIVEAIDKAYKELANN
jgi:hypothetical protein